MNTGNVSREQFEIVLQETKKITYSDKLRHRSLRSSLIFCAGDVIFPFEGKNIPGICRIESEKSERNGKWSGTDYEISYQGSVDAFILNQDWESGLWVPETTWEKALEKWKKSLPRASESAIERYIRSKFIKAAEKLDAARSVLKEDPTEFLETLRKAQEEHRTAVTLQGEVVKEVGMLLEARRLEDEARLIKDKTQIIKARLIEGKKSLSLAELQEMYAELGSNK